MEHEEADIAEDRSLFSTVGQAFMHSLALTFTADIAAIESRHAATRRITTIRSVQTSQPYLTVASADWMLRRNTATRLLNRARSKNSVRGNVSRSSPRLARNVPAAVFCEIPKEDWRAICLEYGGVEG